ncbi:hypothetical protein M434DRAFT_33688 [Hypoxylon sp. CO27-5]|nr:hypothetical protein M434DRAFT_33688 [Hypoxylon sp. CO27-5]
MDSEEGSDYIPSDSNSNSNANLPSLEEAVRKRRHREPEPPSAPRLKRQKGVWNPRYLPLLNEDITDATSRHIKEDPHAPKPTPLLALTPTQLGAITWTAAEKRAFFSALARLGRDDLPGIASRIGSKSVLEVHQYITLLDAAALARRSDESKRQRVPRPADIPAAAELSTELCAALEEAADGLALRQEAYEASLEQKRWAGRWLVTAELATVLEHQHQHQHQKRQMAEGADELPPFVELFPLRGWLRLVERVFMNASVADGNWRAVSEERPAIRATALADFYSLVVSVTRRLVSATLFVAGSRIRAKQAGDRRGRISAVVKAKDVQAAVASVGMKENSREFWARAARRLRLDVYNDENEDEEEGDPMEDDYEDLLDESEYEESDTETAPEDDRSEEEGQALSNTDEDREDYESEPDIMSYEAIEAALGFPNTNSTLQTTEPDNEQRGASGFNTSPISDSDSDLLSDESINEDDLEISDHNQGEDNENIPMKSPPRPPTDPSIDAAALEQDLIEALTYSALDYGDTTRSKQALLNRLKTEQRLWADAERLDARASAAEETRLWSLLRGDEGIRAKTEERKPDSLEPELEPGSEMGLSGRRLGLVDLGGNWRDHTEYYGEWEFREGRRFQADPEG